MTWVVVSLGKGEEKVELGVRGCRARRPYCRSLLALGGRDGLVVVRKLLLDEWHSVVVGPRLALGKWNCLAVDQAVME